MDDHRRSPRGKNAIALGTALALVTGGLVAAAPAAWAEPAADAADTGSAASAAERFPDGVGTDLGATPVDYGVTYTTSPTADAAQPGTDDGRNYWTLDPAAGAASLGIDIDADYLAATAGRELNIVIDRAASAPLTVTSWTADGEAVEHDTPAQDNEWGTSVLTLGTDERGGTSPAGDSLSIASSDGEAFSLSGIRVVAEGARADFGESVNTRLMSVRPGDNDSGIVKGERDGRGYWRTNSAGGSPFVYVDVASSYLENSDERSIVTFGYLADGNGNLGLQYDSPGDTTPDKFKRSATIPVGDAGGWTTGSLLLEDAIYSNRSNGSDFRVTTEGGPDVHLTSVSVTSVPKAINPKTWLDRLITRSGVALTAAREGTGDGQYTPGSKATFAAILDGARAVNDNADATSDEVAAAADALDAGYAAFQAARNTTNIALGASATASSTGSGTPGAVTDGDAGTQWSSARGSGDEWLQIDLGEPTTINDVYAIWGGDYANTYTVSVSTDGEQFTTVGTSGALGVTPVRTRFAEAEARYVRLDMTGRGVGRGGFSLAELEVRDSVDTEVEARIVDTVFPSEDVVVVDWDASEMGADPSGVADSTAGIQAALDACGATSGGTVWLPAGEYRVSDTLEVGPYCTLRGDWRDPNGDVPASEGYGTVVIAELAPGDNGPSLFRIGGSGGVTGVTTFYPEQNADQPVPYNYTFELPGRAWSGDENYMMSTVEHVTMLNSYRGIGISTMPNDRGEGPGSQGHELGNVRDVSGTILFEGVAGFNGADVGVWSDIRFATDYWANAGARFNAPQASDIAAWTRANATAYVLADLEWDQFVRISASDVHTGIKAVRGPRASFTGTFSEADIRNTDIAVHIENSDERWGSAFASSTLQGSVAAVRNESDAYVKLTDTETDGAVEGTVYVLDGPEGDIPVAPASPAVQRPAERLFDVTSAPYGVERTPGRVDVDDATDAIQAALDDAGGAGGGVVYLPAGWYRVDGHLSVPAGVELRGSSGSPTRDSLILSGGTVLFASEGKGTDDATGATAFITLAGEKAGLRGVRVFYPEGNPASPAGLTAFPFTVRADAADTFVINVGLPNAYNGVDASDNADGFVLRRVIGLFLADGVRVGANSGVSIDGLLSNVNSMTRMAYGTPGWLQDDQFWNVLVDPITREQQVLVRAEGSTGLSIVNSFVYGAHSGIVATDAELTAVNFGTDNLGEDGYTADADAGSDVTVVNLMRYNGITSRGPVRIVNPMAINMVESAVSIGGADAAARVNAEADENGARLRGNETRPGLYERGSDVTAIASPADGQRFVAWTDADGNTLSTDAEYTFAVGDELVLSAAFEDEAEPGTDAGSDSDSGAGTDSDSGSDSGAGTGSDSDSDSGAAGSGAGAGSDSDAASAGTGSGSASDAGSDGSGSAAGTSAADGNGAGGSADAPGAGLAATGASPLAAAAAALLLLMLGAAIALRRRGRTG